MTSNAVIWETESHTQGLITQHLYYMYTHDMFVGNFGDITNGGVTGAPAFIHINQAHNGLRLTNTSFARWFVVMNFESADGVIHQVLAPEVSEGSSANVGKPCMLPISTGPGALAARGDYIINNHQFLGSGLLGDGAMWGVCQDSVPLGFTETGESQHVRSPGIARPGESKSHRVIATQSGAFVQPGSVPLCSVVTNSHFVNSQTLGRLALPTATTTVIEAWQGIGTTVVRHCPMTQNISGHTVYCVYTADPLGAVSTIPDSCTMTVKDESGSTLWSSNDPIYTSFANEGTPTNTDYVTRHVGNLGGGNIYVADGNGSLNINIQFLNSSGTPLAILGNKLFCSVADPAVVNPQPPPYDVGTVEDAAVKGGYVASW